MTIFRTSIKMIASGTVMSTDYDIFICVQYFRIMLIVCKAKIFNASIELSIVPNMFVIISPNNTNGTIT